MRSATPGEAAGEQINKGETNMKSATKSKVMIIANKLKRR